VPLRRLRTGKLPPALLRELLGGREDWPPELLLGPALGEDACALDLSGGVLVAACDPITLTGSEVGAHAVVINANDVAVMGVRPRWFLATVLLPQGVREEDVRALFAGMRRALQQSGAILVGGHTEVTATVRQPVVAGQMLGLAEDRRFVPTAGARPGDVVVQVGAAPLEGAAVLAVEASARLRALAPEVADAARRACEDPGISVVEPALQACELGAHALHDPTEGGLAAGLHELAEAAGVALHVDSASILWFPPGRAVCEALGADPWSTLASGALLAAFPAARAEAACAALGAGRTPARIIASVEPGQGVRCSDGRPLPWPERDEVARILAG
jgi:hydrogenase maturation factor